MPVPIGEFDERLQTVRKRMKEEGLEALIAYADNRITGNVRYLSNFSLRYAGYQSVGPSEWVIYGNAIVVVPPEGNATLITDCDFAASVVKDMNVLKHVEFSLDLGASISRLLGPITGKIGITTWDKFPYALYMALRAHLPRAELKPTFIVENLRMIKSPAEISIMRKAAETIDEGMGVAMEALEEGKTEKEICLAAEYVMETRNPSPLFVPQTQVVVFGSRTAHIGYPSQTKLRKGDLVIIDLNFEHDGYCSDIARMKAFGGVPTREQREFYTVSLEMFKKAVEAIRPGAKARAVWDAAAKVAEEAGYGRYAGPLASHGIGLDIQEKPSVGPDETILQPNMVITCEPPLHRENFGTYTEDTILVTETGCESLTKYQRDQEL